jgi:hypothetical protein
MAVGRNDPCPCGSGKKYKQCCLLNGQPEQDVWDLFGFSQNAAHLFAPSQSTATAPKPEPPGRIEQGIERKIEGTAEHPVYV